MVFYKSAACVVIIAAIFFTASCAHKNTNSAGTATGDFSSGIFPRVKDKTFIDDAVLPVPDMDICAPFIGGDQLEGDEYYEEFKEFNVPMAMTSRVSAYIRYFTEQTRKTTQTWLDRSNKYMYLVQDIFVKEGLPTDLVVLAFTESGFNTRAVSHAGAAGMWQFMPGTGKLYGMRIDFWVDERRDFEKATYAAARYLKDLYARFGDWYLALAAYNAGPGKIASATRKHETKDFFQISKNRYTLKLETRDYVPKFLAQLIIYKNYLKYDFSPPSGLPMLYSSVTVPSQTNMYWLAKRLGVKSETLAELNPALKLPITPPGEYVVRVPYGMGDTAVAAIEKATPEERAMYKIYHTERGESIASIAKKTGGSVADIKKVNGLKYDSVFVDRPLFIPVAGMSDASVNAEFAVVLAGLAPKYYKVKRGDTFVNIARKHNMRATDLKKLNPGVKTNRIFPGQLIVVSEGISTSVKKPAQKTEKTALKTASQKKKVSKAQSEKYKVRSGDSLWSIAKKFGTTVDAIMIDNKLSSHRIEAGKILSIKK